MSKIHQLSPHIVAKIAAGEVIERPSFAVKELIENAIDAHASEITIYLEDAGLKKIQIVDNGEGMLEEDLKESYKPHTTSKITDEDNLIGIKSFGFRGEALASLATVSDLTIRSRTKTTSTGNEITIAHGKLSDIHPVGMPEGTTVIAEHLFATIPARKKFLKSPLTELRHTIDGITRFAAMYPTIHFRLVHNKKIVFDTPATNDHNERLQLLLGENFSLFLPVKKEESYVTLSGFIAKPQLTSSTQSKQFLFINKRTVTDKLLSLAVREAYGTMLEPTAYPPFILFIDVPYEMVDVNVHPRKEQVSFVNNTFIFQVVKEKIMEVLEENNITFQNLSWKRSGVGTTNSYAAKILREEVLDKEILSVDKQITLIQLNKLYILVPQKNGFFLVDQHAAHERILFEKLQTQFIKHKKKQKSMQLSEPVVLHLSPAEKILLQEHKKLLIDLGFKIQDSKKGAGRLGDPIITHVPFLFQDRDPQTLVISLLEERAQGKPLADVDTVSEEMMAFLACRTAVKAGDSLEKKQMKEILKKLEETPHNTTCPHGRPTRVFIASEYVNKLFKRH